LALVAIHASIIAIGVLQEEGSRRDALVVRATAGGGCYDDAVLEPKIANRHGLRYRTCRARRRFGASWELELRHPATPLTYLSSATVLYLNVE
jgi:hypothetical protein